MTAKIISIANQKGGCGKTTMTMQLAGALARGKKGKVLIVDGDFQGTATRWVAVSAAHTPFPADLLRLNSMEEGGEMAVEVKKYIEKYDWILIDCPPSISDSSTIAALSIADLALVPMVPSPVDLWASVNTEKLIKKISTINEGLKVRIVASMCQSNTQVSKAALSVIDGFKLNLTKSSLNMRTVYRKSAIKGGTVFDLGPQAKAAAKEVEALAKEVRGLA